jgi:uncharacterized protein YggE
MRHIERPTRIALVILASSLVSEPCDAQPPETHPRSPGITVVGECLAKVVQDRASVTVASSTVAPNSQEASKKTILAHEALKKEVRQLGLPDFAADTADYSVQQECSYEGGKRRCEGYRARIATRFETSDLARIGDVIAVSSRLGSEEVSGLETFASPAKLKEVREACLETATRNAGAKAQKIATGAGVSLGKLASVEERTAHDGAPIPFPRHRQFGEVAMAEAVSAAPSVESKPIDLEVKVTAHYSID